MQIRKLTRDDVKIGVECYPEDADVRGNAMVSGDDEADKKAEDEIIELLESGEVWAWCCVEVAARWGSFSGHNYLGCCSYRNEGDFREGGYFEQMIQEAIDDLNQQVQATAQEISELEVKP